MKKKNDFEEYDWVKELPGSTSTVILAVILIMSLAFYGLFELITWWF